VFVDQVLVSTSAGDAALITTELQPSVGDLHWKGYPLLLGAGGNRGVRPAAYDYDVVQDEKERWTGPAGEYTGYGDVGPLLSQTDDIYAIMHHGDELTLEFDSGELPELPSNWSRSLFLYVDGFLKYVDPYVAHAATVEPLPFHSMTGYPYPAGESYPTDEEHQRYLREYNTRDATGPTDGRFP
jgi:hypothetical protein